MSRRKACTAERSGRPGWRLGPGYNAEDEGIEPPLVSPSRSFSRREPYRSANPPSGGGETRTRTGSMPDYGLASRCLTNSANPPERSYARDDRRLEYRQRVIHSLYPMALAISSRHSYGRRARGNERSAAVVCGEGDSPRHALAELIVDGQGGELESPRGGKPVASAIFRHPGPWTVI